MYKKEADDLLVKKYSKETLKKVHAQYKKIYGDVTFPHFNFVYVAKLALEEVFSGKVHLKYAKETLISLKYAENHIHFQTGGTMLDDIISGQRINFNNYR